MKIKQILFSLAAVALLLSGFTSCNPNQQKLVGTWKFNFTQTNSDDAEADCTTKITFSGNDTYNADGTNITQGTIRYTITITEGDLEGLERIFTYKVHTIGDYAVKGDVLTCTPRDVNFSFVSASTNLDYDLKYLEKELINEFRAEIEKNNFAEPKKELYKTTESTIVSITDHKLVLKDDEGEIEEYTR